MRLIVEAPINSLSFGNVTYNILRQFWRKGVDLIYYPISNQVDFKAFDKIDIEFGNWLQTATQNANQRIDKNIPTFKLWHLNGSQSRISEKQLLYTFYELDEPTKDEINLAKFQTKTIFSSSYASDKFKESGVDCDNIPIGFDEDFHRTNKQYLDPQIVHFGLMGKFEKRKHTEKIIKLWLRKYGNNRKYQLSICVTNPFIKPEDMQRILGSIFEGKNYCNVNVLPYLSNNSVVNEFLNSFDIDLTGLSGAEGWNLPSFNATCLGIWSIVLNATSHKDWSNEKNSILIQPNEKMEEAYDGQFFHKGSAFNQGHIYTWDDDIVSQAMETAVTKKGQINTEGEALKEQFSYEKTASRILTELEAIS